MAIILYEGNQGTFGAKFNFSGEISSFTITTAEMMKTSTEKLIYEVLRVEQGVPLFWEDHLQRLKKSCQQVGFNMISEQNLWRLLEHLYAKEAKPQANLRVVQSATEIWVYYIAYAYPTLEERSQGVATGILEWQREKPSLKQIRTTYKLAVEAKMQQRGPNGRYYELLLLDQDGFFREGSRSNLFFVQGEQIISAPEDMVLQGITRKYILEVMRDLGLELRNRQVSWQEVQKQETNGAFISSSPFDILPVASIEQYIYPKEHCALQRKIFGGYQELLKRYIQNHDALFKEF